MKCSVKTVILPQALIGIKRAHPHPPPSPITPVGLILRDLIIFFIKKVTQSDHRLRANYCVHKNLSDTDTTSILYEVFKIASQQKPQTTRERLHFHQHLLKTGPSKTNFKTGARNRPRRREALLRKK